MSSRLHFVFSPCLLLFCVANTGAEPITQLIWEQLPALPPAQGTDVQPGVAGHFVGNHNGAFILAGGVNFPDGVPWEKGPKVYHKDVFVLTKDGDSFGWKPWNEERRRRAYYLHTEVIDLVFTDILKHSSATGLTPGRREILDAEVKARLHHGKRF
jgi:hypothetical protein